MGNKHVECNRCGTSSVLKKSVTYVRLAQLDRAFGIKYTLRRTGKYFSENKNFFCPQVYIFLRWILQGRIQRQDCAAIKSIWHPNQNRRLLRNLLPVKENGLNALRLLPAGFQPVTHSPEMQGFLQILSTNLHP